MFPKILRLEVITLLCLKAAVLVGIYYVFVVPAEKPEPTGQAMLAHIFNSGK